MSTYVKSGTTVSGTVTTVTLDSWFRYVEVINRSDDDLWVRLDGGDPAENGDNSFIIPGHSWMDINNRSTRPNLFNSTNNTTVVKLLSSSNAVDFTLSGEG